MTESRRQMGAAEWGLLVGLASILNAPPPLYIVLVAHVLTGDEKLSGGRVGDVLLGIAGVGAIVGPAGLLGERLAPNDVLGLGTIALGLAAIDAGSCGAPAPGSIGPPDRRPSRHGGATMERDMLPIPTPFDRDDTCWAATVTRDPAADGRFVVAVRTTGIFCRPTCPARPQRENVSFFASGVAAAAAGFRACRRCHPDAWR